MPIRLPVAYRRLHPALLTICVGFLLLFAGESAFTVPYAAANTPITGFSVSPSTTQAGGHPEVKLAASVENSQTYCGTEYCGYGDARDISFNLPAGLIGDPHATPQCTQADFASYSCPIDSQVGILNPILATGSFGPLPIYNLVPHTGQAGLLGTNFPLLNFPVFTVLSARTGGDYGLTATVAEIFHFIPLSGIEVTLWGVPAEPGHDSERFGPPGCGYADAHGPECMEGFPSNSEQIPFMDNPTTCGVTLSASVETLSYDEGTAQAETTYPGTTGCDQLSFNPSNYIQPTTTATDSASGLALELTVPQEESPTVPSPSEIRATTVTLPPGFVLSPNAADGKTYCSDTEAAFGTLNEATCPEYSRIGTVEIDSAALPGPLPGYIYIGEPQPGDRYRFILTANGFNLHVKLLGSSFPNAKTGQQVVSFQNLPQFPFSAFKLHFFGSERGILETPTQCGTYPVTTTFTPWDAALPEQTSAQFFTLETGPNGAPCPGPTRPFNPGFQASSASTAPGTHTPFSLELTRSDGDQNFSRLSITTPPGLSATLKGVAYCPNASIAAAAEPSSSGIAEQQNPSCPAASQIGIAVAGVGAGTHPVYFPGKVYLAGPYEGAPLSLVVITPGLSGPYDLGNVVVRAALHIDATTAQITAVSDPLPAILQGIPLRYREILIELNRSEFALNPTKCQAMSVSATVSGDQEALVNLSSHFQVANCSSLPFAPKLGLKVSGATKRDGNPSLHATLLTSPGEANIARTTVTLPKGELIDNAHIRNPCTRVQFAEGSTAGERCPAGSVIGFAKAETPLLEKPLEGPVYLRSAPENKSGLPDIVAALNGQIDIDLDGKINTVNGSLRTSFATVPDAPVSKFTLTLAGGRKGLLVNSTNLCKVGRKAAVKIIGQNNAAVSQNPVLQAPCGSNTRHKRHLQQARLVG